MSTKKIIEIFTHLAEINRQLGEIYKARAYQNAISSLKRLPTAPPAKFGSCAELIKKYYVPGINLKGSLCKRIDEIIETGECKELNELMERPDIKVFRDVVSIQDVGVKLARKLIDKDGVKSIEHLQELVRQGKIILTRNQTLGLIHYKHLLQRVPYNEVTQTVNRIKKILLAKYPGLTIIGAGSYRRNSKSKGTSGDIDVLIFHEGKKSPPLEKLTDLLTEKGVILDYYGKGETKFQGITTGMPIVRHIDIRYLPMDTYATAILYFTGSKDFNQTMRQKAIRLGYRLSEYALTNLHNNKPIPVKTEKDVFDKLKMKYVPPWKRG